MAWTEWQGIGRKCGIKRRQRIEKRRDADTHNQISAGSCQLIGTVQMVNGGEKAIEKTKSS